VTYHDHVKNGNSNAEAHTSNASTIPDVHGYPSAACSKPVTRKTQNASNKINPIPSILDSDCKENTVLKVNFGFAAQASFVSRVGKVKKSVKKAAAPMGTLRAW
jgi:hypothetical protein